MSVIFNKTYISLLTGIIVLLLEDFIVDFVQTPKALAFKMYKKVFFINWTLLAKCFFILFIYLSIFFLRIVTAKLLTPGVYG